MPIHPRVDCQYSWSMNICCKRHTKPTSVRNKPEYLMTAATHFCGEIVFSSAIFLRRIFGKSGYLLGLCFLVLLFTQMSSLVPRLFTIALRWRLNNPAMWQSQCKSLHLTCISFAAIYRWLQIQRKLTKAYYLPEKKTVVVLKVFLLECAWVTSTWFSCIYPWHHACNKMYQALLSLMAGAIFSKSYRH